MSIDILEGSRLPPQPPSPQRIRPIARAITRARKVPLRLFPYLLMIIVQPCPFIRRQ